MYWQTVKIDGFTDDFYWSSTENGNFIVWIQIFAIGANVEVDKDRPSGVRDVWAF